MVKDKWDLHWITINIHASHQNLMKWTT